MDVSSENVRFDMKVLQQNKMECLKVVHRFALQWMNNDNCFEDACNSPFRSGAICKPTWFHDLKFVPAREQVHIARDKAYVYYKHWAKKYNFAVVKENTFVSDLASIGIIPERKYLVEGNKKICYTFCKDSILEGISEFYQVERVHPEGLCEWMWTGVDVHDLYTFRHAC